MYKIFENLKNQCSIEFPLLTGKKRKIQFLNTALSSFLINRLSLIGEINGLDFTVLAISETLRTPHHFVSVDKNGYGTLTFLTSDTQDIFLILSKFDCSEGYYFVYLLPQDNFVLDNSLIPLVDHKIDDFLLKLSVHSDSTLFEFEFQDELVYDQFVKKIK